MRYSVSDILGSSRPNAFAETPLASDFGHQPLLSMRAFGWIEQFADPDQPPTRVENSDSARIIIEQGDGIGAFFCFVGDACEGLERVFPEPFDQMESWVLYHESARGSAKVRTVLDALVPYLRVRTALLSGG